MSALTQVTEGVWRWKWFSDEKRMHFNGFCLGLRDGLVLVDPAYAGEETWREIENLGRPGHILLTNKDHERASDELRQRYKIPVWIHEADAPLLSAPPERTFQDGALLWGELETIRFRALKSPGECAFLWKERKILIVGDAVTGHPAGSIGLVKKHLGRAAVLEEIKKLPALDFDTLLVGDGEPFLSGGKQALKTFLESRPASV
ncbi:MAG: hypothetical protein HY611_08030 [Elusimicrobia bacterium]|nr:hypothetical protein [Elusimicrobiota bacterium]